MASLPFVSVILPVYNDPGGLETTIDTLLNQSYPRDRYEILIVDNGSTDETVTIANRFATNYRLVDVLVENEVQSSYAARNRGIHNAEGSLLAFVDADMTVPVTWLEGVVETIRSEDVEYMGCDVQLFSPEPSDTLAAMYNRLSGFPVELYLDRFHFAPTCCLVAHQRVFDDVGLFDQRLVSSGDREFGHRVFETGRELHFADDVTMYHPARTSMLSLVKKAIRIGQGRFQLRLYHPERYGHPAMAFLNPMMYLPPIPWAFRDRFNDWKRITIREKLLLYMVSCLASAANTYGMLREASMTLVRGLFRG